MNPMRHLARGPAIAAGLLAFAIATPASAQQADDALAPLRSCAAIAADAERLACYDAAARALTGAADTGDVQLVDRADLEKTQRNLFGFNVPDVPIFRQDGVKLEKLQTTVTAARKTGRETYRFATEEGAVWEVRSPPARFIPPRAGDPVEIEKASLGSYWIRVKGALGVKGRRVE